MYACQLKGKDAFGTRRKVESEKTDSDLAKSVCECMASELLYQITEVLLITGIYNINISAH